MKSSFQETQGPALRSAAFVRGCKDLEKGGPSDAVVFIAEEEGAKK